MTTPLSDDEIVGKAFDARLMRRMLRFLRPYWALFTVCIALTVVLAGIELAIPYFSKTAIDRDMTLPYAIVTLDAPPATGDPVALGAGRYLVTPAKVPADVRAEWERAGALASERYAFESEDDRAVAAVVARHPDVFTPVPGGAMATQKGLASLPARDLEALRGGALTGIV
ncbi:MAG: hypothetical protein ABFD77_08965, partial [Thermotogota bacterium]